MYIPLKELMRSVTTYIQLAVYWLFSEPGKDHISLYFWHLDIGRGYSGAAELSDKMF